MSAPIAVEEPLQPQVKQCMHEMKGDDRRTVDGSVDRHGRPSIKGKSGGWGVGVLLLLNQSLATLAFYGVGVNLVVFMTRILEQGNAVAANNVSKWMGTAYIFSLVGAFLSDSYWGRYKTCVIFQFIFVTGLVLLSLTSTFFLLKPCTPGYGNPPCEPPTNLEVVIFYLSIYQIALGNGAYQPTITAFGADQFDEEDPKEGHSKTAFFSYFYIANNLGTLFSNTFLVYVEERGHWVLGFWISSVVAFMALVLFVAGIPWYRHFTPGGNPITRIGRVIASAATKWRLKTPPYEDDLYEVDGNECTINGGRKILHTPDFRFLDRAAVVTTKSEEDLTLQDHQTHPPNPWHLCTVTQVEEVKCILRLLPIWLCTIIYSVAYNQMASVFIVQGAAMKTTVSAFHIPPASMSIFEILAVSGLVFLYRLYFIPLFCRYQIGTPQGLTELQRMGLGLVLSALGMVSAGIVESQRLKQAAVPDSSSLSILWQIPQYMLVGASEVFMYVGQMEFFNRQAPDGLKSFGSALYVASMSLGSYMSSLLVTLVMEATRRDGEMGWIADDLNKGHMDRFYFLLASLTAIDFVVFLACAKAYRCILLEGNNKGRNGEGEISNN